MALDCGQMRSGSARHTLRAAVAGLTDAELRRRVVLLAGQEREATVELIGHLAELDARRLHLAEGYGSLFAYCTGALRLAEHAAYNRIEAARLSRRFPVILDLLGDGSLNLSTARLLAPHLRPENFGLLVAEARGRSKREVEVLVARLAPRPDAAPSVRLLPAHAPECDRGTAAAATACPRASAITSAPEPGAAHSPGSGAALSPGRAATLAPGRAATLAPIAGHDPVAAGPVAAVGPVCASAAHALSTTRLPGAVPARPWQRPIVAPLTPERYRVQFTIGAATEEKLRRAQELLRREFPDGDPGAIFDRALTLLLDDVARRKLALTRRPRRGQSPRPGSRHVPARVKRAVWLRDGGRCAFVAHGGRRCRERGFLEFHHREPYAIGGEATFANISLRCRAHNAYEGELVFGPGANGAPPGTSPPAQAEGRQTRPAVSAASDAAAVGCRSAGPVAPEDRPIGDDAFRRPSAEYSLGHHDSGLLPSAGADATVCGA